MNIIGRFDNLSKNKNLILETLYGNDDIVKCLINNNSDFKISTIPNDFDRTSLVYSQMFPFKYIPEIQSEPKTFIALKTSYKPDGMTFKIGSIIFYVITNQSIISTDNGLRYDFLINKIDEIFNSSRFIGVGKLPFYDMDEFVIDSSGKWLGSYICYKTTELQ